MRTCTAAPARTRTRCVRSTPRQSNPMDRSELLGCRSLPPDQTKTYARWEVKTPPDQSFAPQFCYKIPNNFVVKL